MAKDLQDRYHSSAEERRPSPSPRHACPPQRAADDLHKSLTDAIFVAMGSVSTELSKTITQAFRQSQIGELFLALVRLSKRLNIPLL